MKRDPGAHCQLAGCTGRLGAAGMLREVDMGGKKEQVPDSRPWDAAPHLPSRESKLFSLWDASSFSRPCMGSGLFRGAAFSCISLVLRREAR